MCTDIYMPNGDEISILRELKRVFPKIRYREYYRFGIPDPEDGDNDDFCLCSVDIAKTAKVNGYRSVSCGAGDVYFVKRGQRLRNHADVRLQEARRR